MPRVVALLFTFILSLASALAQGDAKLREGDTLNLLFRGIPDAEQASLNGSYRIDDSGMLKLPYVKPFKVAGLTPSQGERAIEKRYTTAEIFANPTITIGTIGTSDRASRTVTVMGEVLSQGAVPFDDKLTAINAIGSAKGFSEFADTKNVKLVRGENSRSLDLSQADSAHARLKLLPGDLLVVKSRGWGRNR